MCQEAAILGKHAETPYANKMHLLTFRFGLYPKLIFLMPGTRKILCMTLLMLVQFLFSPYCLIIW